MRRATAAGLATLAAAGVAGSAPAAAAPAKVDVMVVGRTKVLRPARTVGARPWLRLLPASWQVCGAVRS